MENTAIDSTAATVDALTETARKLGELKAAVWMFLNGVQDRAKLQAAHDEIAAWQDSQ